MNTKLVLGGKRLGIALVDPDDYIKANKHRWYQDGSGYVKAKIGNYPIFLHRFVLGLGRKSDNDVIVDHINGNKLDNRKCNLRIASRSQNLANAKKHKNGILSQYKGVTFQKGWKARIRVNTKYIGLGVWPDEESAARAYDFAAKRYFGEFASLNFPNESQPSFYSTEEYNQRQRDKCHSKYRGVTRFRNKWMAQIRKIKYWSYHKDEIDAARAYNQAVLDHNLGLPLNEV